MTTRAVIGLEDFPLDRIGLISVDERILFFPKDI